MQSLAADEEVPDKEEYEMKTGQRQRQKGQRQRQRQKGQRQRQQGQRQRQIELTRPALRLARVMRAREAKRRVRRGIFVTKRDDKLKNRD